MAGISALGREELRRVVGRGRQVITVEDAAHELSLSTTEAAKRLARWSEHGWLRRVRRGLYIPVPAEAERPERWTQDPLVLADAVWAPCFFTGWTAASHWGLTEQIFRTTVLKTAARVRHSEQTLLDQPFLLVHTHTSDFWGLSTTWRAERKLRVADPARTVIDVLDDPRLGGGIRHVADIVAAYLDEHEGDTLIEYGDRLGNRTVFKRLGFILESLEIGAGLVDRAVERLSSGISTLDPSGPPGGERMSRWGLRANVRLGGRDAT